MGISPTNPGQSPASCRRLEERDSLDLLRENITTILWATGYAYDYGWVSVPVFDDGGRPVQNRGVTQVPGLYFLGLHWMHTFKSRLFLQRRQRRGVPRGTHGSHDGAVTTWPTVPLRSSYGQAFLLLRSTQLGSRNVEAGAVRRAAAFAGFASLSQRGHQTTGTTTRSAGRDSCFVAKEQSWRTAWRARSLLSRTMTGSVASAGTLLTTFAPASER
jgi:hypothetical protein